MKKILIITIAVLTAAFIYNVADATLWEYYNGKLPSISERNADAVKCGIENYAGTSEQNIALENCLRNDMPTVGATLPFAGSTYNLSGSGITSSATSITLQSLTIKQTGQKILDADLSDIFYITIEPGNNTRQEIVECTTLTQNAAGTATLSGCSRGMSPITPYTASSTLRFSHAGGAQVIFSDPPQLFNQLGYLDNNNTWARLNIFGTSTASTDKGYIQISTSTPAYFKNISGVLYYCNNNASCAAIGAGANTYSFILPLITSGSEVKFASSTYDFAGRDGLFALATSTVSSGTASGKGIDDLWNARYNATTTKGLNFTFSDNLSVTGNITSFTSGTSTGVFNFTNLSLGNGNLIYPFSLATTSAATSTITGVSKQGSLATTTIPAASLGTDGMIKIYFQALISTVGGDPGQQLVIKYGGQTACLFNAFTQAASYDDGWCYIINENATNKQLAYGTIQSQGDQYYTHNQRSSSTPMTIDTTANQDIIFDGTTASNGGGTISLIMHFIEYAKR